MPLYEEQFSTAFDLPPTPMTRTLVIASTPRCGSHMLGHTLHGIGRFGFPLEYVNGRNVARWKRITGARTAWGVIDEVIARRTSSNGVFSIKLHYSHLAALGGFAAVRERFPNALFVHLTRNDALAQAISFSIAAQTGDWIEGQGAPDKRVTYRFNQIDGSMKRTLRQNRLWRYQLAASGVDWMPLDFAEVLKDPGGVARVLADRLGVDLPAESLPSEPRTSSQHRARNDEWARRFAEDYNAAVAAKARAKRAGKNRPNATNKGGRRKLSKAGRAAQP